MDFFVENISVVLFLPLTICLCIAFNSLLSNKLDKVTLFLMSVASAFICVLFSVFVFNYSMINNMSQAMSFSWLNLEDLTFSVGAYIDKISVSFLFVLSIINFFLQLIAFVRVGFKEEYIKLLFLQNLFFFGLSGVFISPNLFQTYLFCEVVGVCSYLLINFDFANREQSKAGIKAFIFNRIGDLVLLFCVLTVLYYSVIYNELNGVGLLGFVNLDNISASMNSLMSEPLFIVFCSMFIFVIIMKFVQSLVHLAFNIASKDILFNFTFVQNLLISFIGIFLLLRLNPFFFELGRNWIWTICVLFVFFTAIAFISKWFRPICKFLAWIEKYIVESVTNAAELLIRLASYLCNKFQAGNFQSYLLYSLIGLVFVFVFVLAFYEFLIKV